MDASAAVPPLFRTTILVLVLVCAPSGCLPYPLGHEDGGSYLVHDYEDYDHTGSLWYLGPSRYPLFIGSSWSFRPHYWPAGDFRDRWAGPPPRPRKPPDSHAPRPSAGSERPHGPRESLSPPPRGKTEFPGRKNPDQRTRPDARQRLSPDGHRDRAPAAGDAAPERRIRPENHPEGRVQPGNRPERRVSQENRAGGQVRPEAPPGRRLAPRDAAAPGGRREIPRAGRTQGRQHRR
jgi:hypothetical protein